MERAEAERGWGGTPRWHHRAVAPLCSRLHLETALHAGWEQRAGCRAPCPLTKDRFRSSP